MAQGYCNGCKEQKELPLKTSKYCSRQCWVDNWKPYNTGTSLSGMKGKKHNEISKMKMSKSAMNIHKQERNGHWKGGRQIQPNGYVTINENGNRIYEHRLAMEKDLGRSLNCEECVHHIDGDKTNNNVENLYLFNSNSEHSKYHNTIKQAIINELRISGFDYECDFRGLI